MFNYHIILHKEIFTYIYGLSWCFDRPRLCFYEETSEDKWVECELRKSKVNMYITFSIIIIVVLLCLYFGSNSVRIGAVLLGTIIASTLIMYFYWTPVSARTNYQRFQKELQSYIDNGMSRAQAIQEIKKWTHCPRENGSTEAHGHASRQRGSIRNVRHRECTTQRLINISPSGGIYHGLGSTGVIV